MSMIRSFLHLPDRYYKVRKIIHNPKVGDPGPDRPLEHILRQEIGFSVATLRFRASPGREGLGV